MECRFPVRTTGDGISCQGVFLKVLLMVPWQDLECLRKWSAKPTTSIDKNVSAISFCLFWPVGWLFVFELCLYLFFRLCLPWCTSFLREIVFPAVKGALNSTYVVNA